MITTTPISHNEVEEADSNAPKYWGFWASLGWGILGYLLIILAQLGTVFLQVLPSLMGEEASLSEIDLRSKAQWGLTLGLSFPIALLLITGFVTVVIHLRKGASLQSYLGWRWIPGGTVCAWLAGTMLFEIGMAGADVWLGRPRSPEFLVQAYLNPGSLALLWFSIVVAGPITEELLFRGLVLPGWAATRLGPVGAVILVSLLFAAVHIQYDLYNMFLVFLIGVLLGMARMQTRSLVTPIAMHILINFTGMAVVAYDHGSTALS